MQKQKIILIVVLSVSIVQINALYCGGNCPDNTCSTCVCGSSTSFVDVNAYCDSVIYGTDANKNCCLCIVQQISKGNSNWIHEQSQKFSIGVLGINQNYLKNCGLSLPIEACNWVSNAKCANQFYRRAKNWSPWGGLASRCGCPVSETKSLQQN